MWKSIKREFLLNVDTLWQSMAIMGAAWAVGILIDMCIFHFSRDDEVFIVGLIASGMTLVVMALVMPMYMFSCGYEQALSMGCTRRRFLAGMAVTGYVHLLCELVCVVVLALAESLIGRLLVPDRYSIGKLADMLGTARENLLVLLAALGILLELLCAGIFLGAALQRWGRRTLWGMYGAGIFLTLFGNTIKMIDTDTFIGRIWRALSQAVSFIPGGVWVALGILAAPVLGVVGVFLLLRGSVRQAA